MGSAIQKVDLQRLLAGAQLPALPQSAIKLLELSQDPDNGPAEFAVPIEADPGLTSQVLKFVNSSYFGFSREISSVKLAITLVGIRTIKNFALWSAVFSLMPNPRCGPFNLKQLWQDSLRRGLFARTLAKALKLKEAEDLFVAALLQDMAVPVLAKELPQAYTELLQAREHGCHRLSDLERARFGWTHAEAARRIGESWSLPEHLAVLMGRHTEAERLFADPAAAPAERIVALSAHLPATTDEQWVERSVLESLYAKLSHASVPPLEQLLRHIDAQFDEFAPVLNIGTPARSLAEYFQQPVAT